MSKEAVPKHDCEVMGPDTDYIPTWNPKTGAEGWTCIWCEMAKKVKGEL